MDGLPLTCPEVGTWPVTQACVLDQELNRRCLSVQSAAQPPEPHPPGLLRLLYPFSYCKALQFQFCYFRLNFSVMLFIEVKLFGKMLL